MVVLVISVLFATVGLINSAVISGVNNCNESEFPCDDGEQCVLKNKWCDTTEDCHDDSDEEYCHYSSYFNKDPNFCKDEKFICRIGLCIPFSGVCDGVISCPDGSDEEGCGNYTEESTLQAALSTEDMNTTSSLLATPLPKNISAGEGFTQTASSASVKSFSTSSSTEWITRSSSPSTQRVTTHSLTSHTVPVSPLQDYVPLKSAVIRYPITLEQEVARMKAEAWLITHHHSFSGKEVSRAVVALYLSNGSFFSENAVKSRAISMHLQLEIATDLLRNETKPISISDLALHVNALLASCHNPHNFHGVNLALLLRMRTDIAIKLRETVSPSVYLTLCLLRKGSLLDVEELGEMLMTQNKQLQRLDIQALAMLAAACYSKVPEFSMVNRNLHIVQKLVLDRLGNESYADVYITALLSQALTAAGVTAKDWKMAEALDCLLSRQNHDGSFGDVLATYYVMPTLSGNDMESLKDSCYRNPEKRGSGWLEQNTEEQNNLIDISLCIGNSTESVQSLQLKTKDNVGFLEVLRIAEKNNPLFRLQYDQLITVPTIYAIGGIPNDAERGMFWNIYIAKRKYPITEDYLTALTPFVEDIRTLTVKNGSHIIFWFRKILM